MNQVNQVHSLKMKGKNLVKMKIDNKIVEKAKKNLEKFLCVMGKVVLKRLRVGLTLRF